MQVLTTRVQIVLFLFVQSVPITFAPSWGDPYIIRVTSNTIRCLFVSIWGTPDLDSNLSSFMRFPPRQIAVTHWPYTWLELNGHLECNAKMSNRLLQTTSHQLLLVSRRLQAYVRILRRNERLKQLELMGRGKYQELEQAAHRANQVDSLYFCQLFFLILFM